MKFGIDCYAKQISCVMDNEPERHITFDEAVNQLHELVLDSYIQDVLQEKLNIYMHKSDKESDFVPAVKKYISKCEGKLLFQWYLNSICEFAVYHKEKYMKNYLRLNKYLADSRFFEQIKDVNYQIHMLEKNQINIISTESITIDMNSQSTALYYSVDQCKLSFLSFVNIFCMLLYSLRLSCNQCSICGELFVGTKGEDCCPKKKCIDEYRNTDVSKKKDELSKISRNFSICVRKHRYDLKMADIPYEKREEFERYGMEKQRYVVSEVKRMRKANAPFSEIKRLQKLIKKEYYVELNRITKEILEQNQK